LEEGVKKKYNHTPHTTHSLSLSLFYMLWKIHTEEVDLEGTRVEENVSFQLRLFFSAFGGSHDVQPSPQLFAELV